MSIRLCTSYVIPSLKLIHKLQNEGQNHLKVDSKKVISR